MKKSAFISDLIFTFLVIDVFTLCLFRYLGMGLIGAMLLSILCGALASVGIGALLQSKRKSVLLKKSDETKKEKLLVHLALLSDEKKTQFFQNVLSAQRFAKGKLTTENEFYFIKMRFSPITPDEIAVLSRQRTSKQKVLLCSAIEDAAKTLCDKLQIRVLTGNETYTLIKKADALPQTFLGEQSPVNKRKMHLRLCFSKTNSRRFLVGGVLLLLTSLLTPFPYYYLVFGSILLLTAVFIRIFGYA